MDITWDCFKYVNSQNKSASFESMCRLLFKHQFVSNAQILHTNPNNAGIESEPVARASDGKRISYQAKFFDSGIGYSQIKDSMNKAVSHYASQLDIIYIYCNKSITITSKAYIKIKKLLEQSNIELIPVCDQEILDLLITQQDKDVVKNILKQYFTPRNQFSDKQDAQSETSTVIELAKTISVLSSQVDELQPIVDDHKKLADTLYNEIIQIELSHDEKAMWEKLKPYVENDKNYSNKNYINYFHLAAQLCLKFCREDSEKYFNIAVKLHDKLDQRLYRAAMLIEDGKHDEALKVLGNIDSVNILNQYLYCLYNLGKGSECANTLSEHSDIVADDLTFYVSALCFLQSCNFDKAEENINELLAKSNGSLKYRYMIAVIYYWRYIPSYRHIQPSHGLAIPDAEKYYATTEQINGLKEAAMLFEKTLEAATGKSQEIERMALSGCLLCAWFTNDIKKYEYRDKLLSTDIADCVAISFNLVNKEPVSSDSIAALTEKVTHSGRDHELILLLRYHLINKNLEEFNELLRQHADVLATISQDIVLDLRIDALLLAGNYDEAKYYINSCNLDIETRDRALFVITANNASSSKSQIEKLGKELVAKYGTDVDYYNLTHFYYWHKKWGGLAHFSEEWHKKQTNILALSYKAIALFNKNKRDEAMGVLQNIEEIAILTPALCDLKINIFIANSQFDDAIAMIRESSFRTDDEKVVLRLSTLYANVGDLENAIDVLKEFVGRHPENIQATAYLVQYLERVEPNKAYYYAKQIALHHPDNPQILLNWMNIGFKTNNDNEVAHLISKISNLQKNKHRKNKTKCWIEIRDMQSMIKFLKEQEEHIKKTYDSYYDCRASIHMVLDQLNRKLGEFIYTNWLSENGSILFWHYGGKPDTLFTKTIQSKRIIMDYTACLTAYCLDLFAALDKYFEIIYVEPYFLQVINSEIVYVKNLGQPSREAKERLLLDFIDKHKDRITIIPQPNIEDIENAVKASGAEPSDAVQYLCANSVNAIIVTNSFATELAKKRVPQEYENIRERKQALFNILIENDVMHGKLLADGEVRKIKVGDSILIDNVILGELADTTNLSDFLKLFKVYITQTSYEILRDAKRGTENRQMLLSWMTDFESTIKGYIVSGKIKYLKQYPDPLDKLRNSHMLTRSLCNCVLAFTENRSDDSSIALWSDDRYLSKCNWIVNVFDVLQAIKQDAVITEQEYSKHISELIKRDVKYYVPSADYIFACLQKAQMSDNSITETPRLEALRRSVNNSLREESKIGRVLRKVEDKSFAPPEYGEYIIRLRESFQNTVALIWNDTNRDNVWKAVASAWCLTNLSDFVCDVMYAKRNEVGNTLVFKHFSLIHLTLMINESCRVDYAAWVFAFLGYRWLLFPNEYENVVALTANFINGINGEAREQTDYLQQLILQRYAAYLPAQFVYSLFTSSVFNGKWESCNPYEIVQEEELSPDIPSDQKQEQKPFKPIEANDYFEYLKSNPNTWLDVFRTIAENNKEKPHNAIVGFIKEYIDKYGTSELPRECQAAIAVFAWQCPPEDIAAASEIRRKLS